MGLWAGESLPDLEEVREPFVFLNQFTLRTETCGENKHDGHVAKHSYFTLCRRQVLAHTIHEHMEGALE